MTEFFQACEQGDLEKVKVLVENKAVNYNENNPAFHAAGRNGHLEILKFLVTGDPKVDITQKNWALWGASCYGHLEIVKFLVENKADVAMDSGHPVRVAAENGHLETVKFLVENKADITAENNYAVRWAARNGHLEIVKFLVENKADITAGDNYALRAATREGHLETVKFLLENKADITAENNYAVRYASRNGHLETVKFLLENKADITANNNEAFRWVVDDGHAEVVKYLESLSNPPPHGPLSKQALLKAKEKHLPKQAISEFLEKNLGTIVENLSLERKCELDLSLNFQTPWEEVVNIVVSWLKEKGLENAENKVVIQESRPGFGLYQSIAPNTRYKIAISPI